MKLYRKYIFKNVFSLPLLCKNLIAASAALMEPVRPLQRVTAAVVQPPPPTCHNAALADAAAAAASPAAKY